MALHGLDLNGIAALVGAMGTAVTGVIVSVSGLISKRNANRREELRTCELEREHLEHEVLLLELWAFQLQRAMVTGGLEPIPRPVIAPTPIEYES